MKNYSLLLSVGLLAVFFLAVFLSSGRSSDFADSLEWATKFILPWLFFFAFILIFGRRK
ncbi:hypothetical protein [Cohnella nanjingensis]|uniref:Uncharacterized protein n=1 Tax=Cohnella nanjingensis TaxID=1387779 RepID=A0A7X0VGZ9_9BACL|nr:hypothetical protein [Cohnella nanjingensis]MBB6673627.1 hypothetical protein [Cohnella nanjingensis]